MISNIQHVIEAHIFGRASAVYCHLYLTENQCYKLYATLYELKTEIQRISVEITSDLRGTKRPMLSVP